MPKVHVQRSEVIHAPKAKILDQINDFHNWPKWSPWLITDPKATVDVREDGKYYRWTGPRVGEGEMTVERETDTEIDFDLKFFKPWKSKAKTYMKLESIDDQNTKLSWSMDTKMPFFLFFMKNMMKGLIGMDYERGLKMLKDLSEQGNVPSNLGFPEPQSFDGSSFIGIKRKTTIADMPQEMAADFERLHRLSADVDSNGLLFSQYHKFNFGSGTVEYTAGLGVKSKAENAPEGMILGDLPAASMMTVRHTGPYKHIGNAWSAAQFMVRSKEYKVKRGYHPIEIYRNSPADTPEDQLVTDICFALK